MSAWSAGVLKRSGAPREVVAAVVRRGDAYLVGRRPEHKRHGGLWEFPGGKIHPGEDDLAAACRELDEELELCVTGVGRVVFVATDPASGLVIRFVEVSAEGEPQALEHTDIRWADAAELRDMELAPTDARFVRERIARTDARS